MVRVSLEGVLGKVDSVYKLVNLASRRALELSEGAPALTKSTSDRVLTIALEEIRDGKVTYRVAKEKRK